jgi:hypothetical protein
MSASFRVYAKYSYLPTKCLSSLFIIGNLSFRYVMYSLFHHGMARPQAGDGGDGLQIWKVATNILNKQWRTKGDR